MSEETTIAHLLGSSVPWIELGKRSSRPALHELRLKFGERQLIAPPTS